MWLSSDGVRDAAEPTRREEAVRSAPGAGVLGGRAPGQDDAAAASGGRQEHEVRRVVRASGRKGDGASVRRPDRSATDRGRRTPAVPAPRPRPTTYRPLAFGPRKQQERCTRSGYRRETSGRAPARSDALADDTSRVSPEPSGPWRTGRWARQVCHAARPIDPGEGDPVPSGDQAAPPPEVVGLGSVPSARIDRDHPGRVEQDALPIGRPSGRDPSTPSGAAADPSAFMTNSPPDVAKTMRDPSGDQSPPPSTSRDGVRSRRSLPSSLIRYKCVAPVRSLVNSTRPSTIAMQVTLELHIERRPNAKGDGPVMDPLRPHSSTRRWSARPRSPAGRSGMRTLHSVRPRGPSDSPSPRTVKHPGRNPVVDVTMRTVPVQARTSLRTARERCFRPPPSPLAGWGRRGRSGRRRLPAPPGVHQRPPAAPIASALGPIAAGAPPSTRTW